MTLGIPIVCNAGVGDTDAIVEKYNAGKIISPLNEENYSKIPLDPNVYDVSAIWQGASL